MAAINEATGTVVNNTQYELFVLDSGIDTGHWTKAPVAVPANATKAGAFVAQGSPGTASGSSGWVQYGLQGTDPQVVAYLAFDDPWSSPNSAGGTNVNSSAFVLTASFPKSGSQVTFTYTLGPASAG